MRPEDKLAYAEELAKIAIIKLASSAQGIDLFTVFKSFSQAETHEWLDHMAEGWSHDGRRFIENAKINVVEAIDKFNGPPQHLKRELIQAKVVLGKGAPNWRRLKELNFNPNTITADIAQNSKHAKTASPFSTNHALFSALYAGLPQSDEAYAELDLGINHQARKLILTRDAAIKELNEMHGWAALLTLACSPYSGSELTPARLLDPVLNIVPYQHQKDFDKAFQAWMEQPKDVAIRLFGAPGGSGKTRAMLESCLRYAADGWCTGFLNEDPVAQQFPGKAYEQFFSRASGVLIVVDHAQDRHKQLNLLLSAVQKAKKQNPIRIVLLSRVLNENWLTYFHALASPETEELMRSSPIKYKAFPAIASDSHLRQAIFDRATDAFSAELGLIPARRKLIDLDAKHFQHPLYLCIAAMLNLYGDNAQLPAKQMILELLRLEQKHWRRNNSDAVAVAQIMTSITLWQGAGKRQIARIQQLWPGNSAARQADPKALQLILEELYGQVDNTIAPLRPDIVGEQLVTNIITKHMRSVTQIAFSTHAAEEQRKQACNIISRLPVDKIAKSDQLAIWLSDQLKTQNDVLVAAQMIERFPEENSSFARLDERAAYIVRKHLINQYTGSIDDKIALSLILHYHGVRLAQQGDLKDAVKAVRPATKLRRELVDIDYDTYAASLAESLSSLSSIHNTESNFVDAATGAKETVRLNRHLAKNDPKQFIPELAWSLSLLAHSQFKLRQLKEALPHQEEAVSIYRDLNHSRPDEYVTELAQNLQLLAELQNEHGIITQSLTTAQEATARYRKLAHDNPALRPDLSTCLNLVADNLSSLGQNEAALESAREATRIDRQLTNERVKYEPFLARSLGNLANIFAQLKQFQSALDASENAVSIYRNLAYHNGQRFTPILADNLSNLSYFLTTNHLYDGALKTAEEAVTLRRQLAHYAQDSQSPELASALCNLSNAQHQKAVHNEALQSAQEAVNIYQVLSKQWPERYTPELATAMGILGQAMLSKRGQAKAAVNCFSEAIFLLTPHFEVTPTAYSELMSGLIKEYEAACENAKKKPDAGLLKPLQEILNPDLHH